MFCPKVNSALPFSGVAKSSTSFGWGKGGNVTSAGWPVTLCDPIWHVSSRSGEAFERTAIHDFTFTFTIQHNIHSDRTLSQFVENPSEIFP